MVICGKCGRWTYGYTYRVSYPGDVKTNSSIYGWLCRECLSEEIAPHISEERASLTCFRRDKAGTYTWNPKTQTEKDAILLYVRVVP
jgi:hypothetical protein